MYAPTYLSDADRDRLVAINQLLLTGIEPEEKLSLSKERDEIMANRKDIANCTYEELQTLRQYLFGIYQKHASIGSKQQVQIASYIKQVEYRQSLIASKMVAEPEKPKTDDKTAIRSKSRVSSKQSSYSWTIDLGDDD